MNDKFKSCKDCPDRSVTPNCHSTCEGYLYRVKKREELNAKRKKVVDFDGYLYDRAELINRRKKRFQKNKKKFK